MGARPPTDTRFEPANVADTANEPHDDHSAWDRCDHRRVTSLVVREAFVPLDAQSTPRLDGGSSRAQRRAADASVAESGDQPAVHLTPRQASEPGRDVLEANVFCPN